MKKQFTVYGLRVTVVAINIAICCLLASMPCYAQQPELSHPPDTYRSSDNPYYWKNRPPFQGYWQQDVHYTIKAELNDSADMIDGSEQLTYYNNSPDTLTYVYFHLYQNAFQPGSYLDELTKNNGVTPHYSKHELDKLGTVVEYVRNEGGELKMELDNTILKVYLSKPLYSNSSVMLDIHFKTYYGNGDSRRRMKMFTAFGFKHYDGVQWFPKISVYDRKFGWTADQHLNREFYGDYGTYDVDLTLPNIYILEATGNLLNRDEVLPDSLRKKLDIKNFKDKAWNSAPSVIMQRTDKKKTWKFHAENVHDFAFTADPTYRIGETEWNGIKCIALAEEEHAALWQNAADYTAKIIKVYSEDFGMYAYPKIIVADARDGMEYPMLTLDGGYEPNYRYLFSHEVGHQWFYGMVGNNETYRAALDEGFTQFITIWSQKKIDGDTAIVAAPKNKYAKHFTQPQLVQDRYMFNPYESQAIRGEDGFINTHSDHFNGALGQSGGYVMVYHKTAAMLTNLQYVLGDSLFLASMSHYFNQWKFCHPYFEDFRNSVIHFTHVDLNWFFDQWMETDKRIDFGIKSVKHGKATNDFLVTFKRKERMEMPLDFSVYSKAGIKYDYHIPNRNFIKQTTATVLPKWFGWDKLNPTYTAEVHVPGGIQSIVIDTTNRLADINLLDNRKPFPAKLIFDSQISTPANRYAYVIKWRPDIWYNNYDGFKIGLHADGNYFNYSDFLNLDVWANTGLAQSNLPEGTATNKHDPFSYHFTYHAPADNVIKNSSFTLNAKWLDGLMQYNDAADVKTKNLKTRFYLNFQALYRQNANELTYLLYPGEWQPGKWNNTAVIGLEHTYTYQHGSGDIDLASRSSTVGSNYNYSYITLTVINRNIIGKLDFNTRAFAEYGTGTSFANESSLFLAGANPEELMNDKFTRSRAFVPTDWLGYGATTNHFQEGGGLNLRGYAGYLVAQTEKNGAVQYVYKGTSGASFSGEMAFDRLIKLHPAITNKWLHFTPYFFGDAGVINDNAVGNTVTFADLRADAGAGIAMTIKKFGPLQTVKPFTLRFDVPLVLNHPPLADPDYIKFRWVVGVGRTF